MPSVFSFADACSLVDAALERGARSRLIADLSRSQPFGRALARLRAQLRANSFDRFIGAFDHRTRQDGFHALHDWDGKADHVVGETIPVDVLDYVARQRPDSETSPRALGMILDYYYFHILQLLSLRIWDEGDADANLDRLGVLLDALQGPDGSGQRFVTNAETLILIATSHFEVVERGYDKLLRRVRTLNRAHQINVALGHASSMGSHLRFGFEATYSRDTTSMRDDNVADYPWLCFALATLMREYVRLRTEGARAFQASGAAIVEAILNGLSPDARAFVGAPPPSLSRADAEREEFRDAFLAHRSDLLTDFERHRPVDGAFSPLSFFFNFSHNVVKGTIVDALLRGEPWPVVFNDMLTGLPMVRLKPDTTDESPTIRLKPDTTDESPTIRLKPDTTDEPPTVRVKPDTPDDERSDEPGDEEPQPDAREQLARTLMAYARENPDRIRGRLMPVIVYDPRAGNRAFRVMMEKLAPSP